VLTLLLCHSIAAAQEHLYWNISTQQGLPSANVYSCNQDPNGYLWVCTAAGLARYDGQQVEVFDGWPGISGNEIFAAAADNTGKLWFNCFSPVHSLLYYKNDSVFTPATDASLLPYSQFFARQSLNCGNRLYLGAETGLLVIRNGHPDTLFRINADLLLKDNRDSVWAVSKGKFYLITPSGPQLKDSLRLPTGARLSFYNNELFLYANRQITIYRFQNGQWLLYKQLQAPFNIYRLFVNRQGIWLIDDDAHRMYHATDRTALARGNITTSISGADITLVYEDDGGNIWACSADKGLFLLKNPHLKLLRPDPGRATCLYSLAITDGALLAGADNGHIYRLRGGSIKTSQHHNRRNRVLQLEPCKPYIYVANDEGIWQLDGQRSRKLYNMAGKMVCRVNDTLLAFGTAGSLILYHAGQQQQLARLRQNRVYAAAADGEALWLGTEKGLAAIQLANFQPLPGHAIPPVTQRVTSLCLHNPGSPAQLLLVGTLGHGIVRCRGNGIVDTLHTGNSPLPSNNINRIRCRGDTLYVATTRGMVIWVGKQRSAAKPLYSYTAASGLLADNVNDWALLGDTLWLATGDGAVAVTSPALPPKPVYLLPLGTQTDNRFFSDTQAVEARMGRPLSFAFSAIEYCGPEALRYHYRLWPLQQQWQITAQPQALYQQVPPGRYRFEVYATSFQGQRSRLLAISVRVRAHWWQTVGGRTALIVGAIGLNAILLWLLVRRMRQRTEKRLALRQRMLQSELDTLRSQMNPHFIFNSLNVVQALIVQQNSRAAARLLADFSKLIRSALQLSKKDWIALQEELHFVQQYLALEKIRLQGFAWEITVAPNIDSAAVEVPALITQPFIENALLHGIARLPHGQAGLLRITVAQQAGRLYIRIADNGVGMEATAPPRPGHRSMGLQLVGERLRLLNEQYHTDIRLELDKAPQGGGTCVTIDIPL
jgi:ligand-binding sensor domain-containing protein